MNKPKGGTLQNLLNATKKNKHDPNLILQLPVDRVINKEQVRVEFQDIEELAASLLEQGQLSPITVSPRNADGKHVILVGERRWRAAKHAGLDTIDAIVSDKQLSVVETIAAELIENIQRDNLEPLEIALGLQKMLDEDKSLTKGDLVKLASKSATWVSNHLRLLKLPDCVMQLYNKKITRDHETLLNLGKLYRLESGRCEAMCAGALAGRLEVTRAQSRDLIKDAKQAVKAAADFKKKDGIDASQQASNDPDPETIDSNDQQDDLPPVDDASVSSGTLDKDNANDPAPGNAVENGADTTKAPAAADSVPETPATITILVNALVEEAGEDKLLHGTLMTDRLPTNEACAWVRLDALSAEADPVEIELPLDQIGLIAIKG